MVLVLPTGAGKTIVFSYIVALAVRLAGAFSSSLIDVS